MDVKNATHALFSGLDHADASFVLFPYLAGNLTSARIAAMSPGLSPPPPPPPTVDTDPTVPSPNIPIATAVGLLPTVLSVASQCISTSWPPSSSQLECVFSRVSSTGTYSQSPPSRTSDDTQPITPSCTSRGGDSCASVDMAPTEPSAALVTPSASDLSTKPLTTATSRPAQSPSQSQINTTPSQGGHTISVGLTVGLILLGVFLAILIACFILRYRRHLCRRRVKDPLIDSILPLEKAIWPLPDITNGVESTFSSLPPPRTSFDSGPSMAPSVSVCAESSYTQRSNTDRSMYPKDFHATGIAL
ncbi:hypothetical protein EDD15DRAFT_2318959 [Pisolithus albus]|nr:hypothetical protein EDD15DRAFT_2318959 [Pisolithus albus]